MDIALLQGAIELAAGELHSWFTHLNLLRRSCTILIGCATIPVDLKVIQW